MTHATTGQARKPFSKTAIAGLLVSLTGAGLFATSVIGYRSGSWFWPDALNFARGAFMRQVLAFCYRSPVSSFPVRAPGGADLS